MSKARFGLGVDLVASEVAGAVRARLAGMARQIEQEISAAEGAGDGQVERLLGGDAASLLQELAGLLENGEPGAHAPRLAVLPGQAPVRAGEMLRAWRALRHAVVENVGEEMGRDLHPEEVVALEARLDELMARRVSAAIDTQLDQFRVRDEAQARFVSFMSHDLRGGLNGVLLMLEVVRRELQPRAEFAETVSDLLLMRRSILETVAMVERHVQADRMRRGKVPLNPAPQPLRRVVEELVGQMQTELQEKQKQVAVEVPADAMVHADRELLKLAARNLLDNAVRFGGAGLVSVTAARVDGRWALAVQDSGPGIEPQRLEALLDPLQRMQLKEKGLGLTLAQQAAQLMGGALEADSQVGSGSTFRLILPAAQ